jgi:tetratricopeptide (TPR) repeat protein
VTFASALAASRGDPTDPNVLAELARTALQEGEEEQALAAMTQGVGRAATAELWQWKGLLERALDEHEHAVRSMAEAVRLDPLDASIAHGRARIALEAGLPAEALFEQALRLLPNDGAIFLGLIAARLASGNGERAEMELDSALGRSPLWVEGHHQLGQLRSMLGKRELAAASIERALRTDPKRTLLWQALFNLHLKSDAFQDLEAAVAAARSVGTPDAILAPYEAIAASELGKTEAADRLFETNSSALPIWRIRHLIRSGRIEEALPVIDRELANPAAAHAWPYAELAWRAVGDPRWQWLVQTEAFIRTFDLSAELPPLDRLASVLRSLHQAKSEYLDQSVRGGTQTDGPLFSRIEPEIRTLRSAVVRAVEQYVAGLPERDSTHPLLSCRRDRRVRFAGSWSVRLRGEGFHTSHVHPRGWISSALYVELPPGAGNDSQAGDLQLGAPREDLNLPLEPLQVVKPQPGRLILFPSWMWHGTMPFQAGERLTVAFDVAAPR